MVTLYLRYGGFKAEVYAILDFIHAEPSCNGIRILSVNGKSEPFGWLFADILAIARRLCKLQAESIGGRHALVGEIPSVIYLLELILACGDVHSVLECALIALI